MSIIYNQQISNLEFSLELGDKNLIDIQKKIEELIKTKSFILEMKENNKLSLSVLRKKKLQEDINIKFLPFLPKEVNENIRSKMNIFKYEELGNIYKNMILDYIVLEQYRRGTYHLKENVGSSIIEEKENSNFTFSTNWRGLLWEREEMGNNDRGLTCVNGVWNYEVLNNIEITNEIVREMIQFLNRGFNDFDSDELDRILNYYNMKEDIEYCYRRKIVRDFKNWNFINMNTYFKKNINWIIQYSINVDIKICKTLNVINEKIKNCMNKTNETKYWTMIFNKHEIEDLYDKINWYGGGDYFWNGCENNDNDKVKKYCENFIDKKKIPIVNKNGKLSNKTNYAIMGYDIAKYFQERILTMRYNYYIEEEVNEPLYNNWGRMNYWFDNYITDTYYVDLFTRFYITKSGNYKEYMKYINVSNDSILDWEEVDNYLNENGDDLSCVGRITNYDNNMRIIDQHVRHYRDKEEKKQYEDMIDFLYKLYRSKINTR